MPVCDGREVSRKASRKVLAEHRYLYEYEAICPARMTREKEHPSRKERTNGKLGAGGGEGWGGSYSDTKKGAFPSPIQKRAIVVLLSKPVPAVYDPIDEKRTCFSPYQN